ncbi:MAG: hypothetical protein ACE5OY_00195 [Candidatus Bathyarchaeia archaeon]
MVPRASKGARGGRSKPILKVFGIEFRNIWDFWWVIFGVTIILMIALFLTLIWE